MLRTLLERIQERLIATIMVPLMTHRINRSTYPLALTAEGSSVMVLGPPRTVSDLRFRIPNPVNQLDCKSERPLS